MSRTQALEVVKKNIGAIHIKNDISCLQRKVWNVLLSNAYEELPDVRAVTHSITVRDLMGLSGFNSKNVGYLKDALEDMVTTKLNWNIIDERGKTEWGVSTALASATIKDGICSYAYSPHLREKLYNPEYYAPLNILILSSFSSGHALALYENCVRYRGINQTPIFSVELFRDLIGVGENSSYDDFKVLNKAVIKPALKEVNTVSDIKIDVEMKKEKRRVVGLKFTIQDNAQATLPMEAPHTFNVAILTKLQEYFCLTEKQAKEVMVTHSEDRIVAVMQYVEKRYTEGKVRQGKIAPYFLKVVKDGDINVAESAFDLAKRESENKKKLVANAATEQEQIRTQLMQERREKIRSYYAQLSDDERTQLNADFSEVLSSNTLLFGFWRKDGIKSKAVETEFYGFIGKKILPTFESALEARLKERA